MQSVFKKGLGVLATRTSLRSHNGVIGSNNVRILKRVVATDAMQVPPAEPKRGWKFKALTLLGSFFVVAYVADTTMNDDWDNVFDTFRPRLSSEERKTKPRLVILGAGWGALSMLRKLHTDQFNVTVSPRNYFLFTPLLPSTTTGELEARSIIEPIRKYCERAGAIETSFIEAECVEVDPVTQKVTCVDNSAVKGEVSRFDLPYDYLVVSVGAANATFNIPGVKEYACFMKEVDDSRQIRDRIMDCVETAMIPGQPESEIKRLLNFVVVGGGPSGVEFTADLHDFIKKDIKKHFPTLSDKVQITLVEALPHILNMFDIELISVVEQRFQATDSIKVLTNSAVTDVKEKAINIKKRETNEQIALPYGMLVWATGNTPREVTSKLIKSIAQMNPEPTQNNPRGLRIDDRLRVIGTNNIWAIGDCTTGPLPATAQVAGQQGRYLGRLFNQIARGMDQDAKSKEKPNLEGTLALQTPFIYKHLGMLAYIGDQRAIAEFRKEDKIKSSGLLTFFLWRSVYFSRLLSYKNRMSVAYDWFKAAIFGRDISRC